MDKKHAYQIVDGEIRKGNHKISPDIIALEILTYLPEEERSPEKLLEKVRKIDNLIP